MRVYLEDIPLQEAQSRLGKALAEAGLAGVLGRESIPLDHQAVGRILAEPLWARISSPHYHASAMDGFAVRSAETHGALETAPLIIEYGQGTVYLDTGDPVPLWADAVIPIENVESLDLGNGEEAAANPRRPGAIRIRAAAKPWMNIRPMGEDMVATELVLPAGQQLRAVDLGAAAGCGYDSLQVARKPRVAILPTGTELVNPGEPVAEGDIIEYNSIVLAAQLAEWGAEPERFPNIPDDLPELKTAVLKAAAEHDLVLIIAGSSAGSEDYTARIVAENGQLLVHGVAVRPGHPVILGLIEGITGKVPAVGVPGYPVSAALTAEIFVQPLIQRWLGKSQQPREKVEAVLTRKITSPPGDDDYIRVAVGKVGKKTLAAPLSRGSGVITSLVRADGLLVVPRGVQGYPAGEKVSIQLIRSRAEIEETIFAVGSHDITLDIMAQFLAEKNRRLTSANVGSLGGIMTLKRGETHLAGAHLLDPDSGEYNLPYIKQHLPGRKLRVVTLVSRVQGLIIPAGNPKNVAGLADLVREDIRFVNRQPGAGTRYLLDYHLSQLEIAPDEIQGYQREEFTHLTAAAAVASKRADCTLGIQAAASALELDFLPLFQERYDLIIPGENLDDSLLQPLLDLLHDKKFQAAVSSRPGYDVSQMGQVVADLPESD